LDDYSELASEELPKLIRDSDLDIADLGGPDAELSTGLILTWRDQLVFSVEPKARPLGAQGRANTAAFVGIGGHVEIGETWSQAVTREALEETHCPISLGDSTVTYLCRQGQVPRPLAYCWNETYRPLLVWLATFPLRRGPERMRIPTTLVVTVFRAAALGCPAPGAEVEALLLLDQETLLHTYAAPRHLGELLDRGAQIIGRSFDPDTLIAPGGSAYFYAQWLTWQEQRRIIRNE